MLVESITTKVTFEDNSRVKVYDDVIEKNVGWNSLYVVLVEGNEIKYEDMVDLDKLYEEYVLDEDIDN